MQVVIRKLYFETSCFSNGSESRFARGVIYFSWNILNVTPEPTRLYHLSRNPQRIVLPLPNDGVYRPPGMSRASLFSPSKVLLPVGIWTPV